MSDMSVRLWIEKYNSGAFDKPERSIQIDAGWYDWFCRDNSLVKKTKKLASKVKRVARSPKINIDTMYVWFKNNCPVEGSLYDDFRFADIKTGDVIYTIIPSSGHNCNKGEAEIWGKENDFDEPSVQGTWKDVLKYFEV
jgi:hypothetical protein